MPPAQPAAQWTAWVVARSLWTPFAGEAGGFWIPVFFPRESAPLPSLSTTTASLTSMPLSLLSFPCTCLAMPTLSPFTAHNYSPFWNLAPRPKMSPFGLARRGPCPPLPVLHPACSGLSAAFASPLRASLPQLPLHSIPPPFLCLSQCPVAALPFPWKGRPLSSFKRCFLGVSACPSGTTPASISGAGVLQSQPRLSQPKGQLPLLSGSLSWLLEIRTPSPIPDCEHVRGHLGWAGAGQGTQEGQSPPDLAKFGAASSLPHGLQESAN